MKKRSLILLISIIILALLIWAPWITDEFAKQKVMSTENFIRQHSDGIPTSQVNVGWAPFGKTVTTYEGIWFVIFTGNIL